MEKMDVIKQIFYFSSPFFVTPSRSSTFSPGPSIILFDTFLMYDRSNLSRIG